MIKNFNHKISGVLIGAVLGFSGIQNATANNNSASVELTPNVINAVELLQKYQQKAKQQDKTFMGFSAIRGYELYHKKVTRSDGKTLSCATCHNEPQQTGRHPETHKPLAGMAPALYPKRFSNPHEKIEVAFKRNCSNVFSRDCTVLEKGDILTYLLSVKKK